MLRRLVLPLAVLTLAGSAVPVTASADTYSRVNAAISPYLSAMIDDPSTAHSNYWAARTNIKLLRIASGKSRSCRGQIWKVRKVVLNLDLSAKKKRKRMLDAAAPTYYRC